MDKSKLKQTEHGYTFGSNNANVNIVTGRALYNFPLSSIGSGNFHLSTYLTYNTHYNNGDFNKKIGFNNGFKLNVQQYIFPYATEYNLSGFNTGDYVYIDEGFRAHQFVYYKDKTDSIKVYYDKCGCGLKLYVDSSGTKEIIDDNNNKLVFNTDGCLVNIISGINGRIQKVIKYENDNVVAIYDDRKNTRKITFKYDSNNLLTKVNNGIYSINFMYSLDNKLVKISKEKGLYKKDVVYLVYNDSSNISLAVDAQSMKGLEVEYDSLKKILKVQQGKAVREAIKERITTNNYCGDGYIEDEYCSNEGYMFKGYNILLNSNYITDIYDYTYSINKTIIKNKKDISIVYYYDLDGQVTAMFEKIDDETLKTLSKDKGYLMRTNTENTSTSTINNIKQKISINSELSLLSSDSDFLSMFDEEENANKENFIISMWFKPLTDMTEDLIGTLSISKKNSEDSSSYTSEYYTIIRKTKEETWQYIEIPVVLEKDQTLIENITFKASNPLFHLCNIRIRESSNANSYISNIKYDITKPVYVETTSVAELNLKDDTSNCFYMTANDFIKTYKNIYTSQVNGDETYDFVCCRGQRIIEVKKSWMLNDNNKVYLELNESNEANYSTKQVIRISDSEYSIIKNFFKYDISNSINYIYNYSLYKKIGSKDEDITTSTCDSYSFKKSYIDGRVSETLTEYGVCNMYMYDNYGNFMYSYVYNNQNASDQIVLSSYEYDSEYSISNENVVSIVENDIKTEYQYDEYGLLTKVVYGKIVVEYVYDVFNEKILKVNFYDKSTNELLNTNKIRYNGNEYVRNLNDSNYQYYFKYDKYGDIKKQYSNFGLLVENEVIVDGEEYKTNIYYDKDSPVVFDYKYDKYGKLLSVSNSSDSYIMNYENGSESAGVLLTDNIVDNDYIHKFEYDKNNNLKTYKISYDEIEKERIEIQNSNTIKYNIRNSNKSIIQQNITEDGNYLSPRIKQLKYIRYNEEDETSDYSNYIDFSKDYEYDDFGRIIKIGPIEKTDDNECPDYEKYVEYEYSQNKSILEKINHIVDIYNGEGEVEKSYSVIYCPKLNSYNYIDEVEEIVNVGDYQTYKKINYLYDEYGRIKEEKVQTLDYETKTTLISEEKIEYEYQSNNLYKVIKGTDTKEYEYQNGKLAKIKLNDSVNRSVQFDDYGNMTSEETKSYNYKDGQLYKVFYNKDGIDYYEKYRYNYNG